MTSVCNGRHSSRSNPKTLSGKCFRAVSLALMINLISGWAGLGAQPAFEDVSEAAGFSGFNSETWGASWGDINGDLYPDIFISNHRTRANLFRNTTYGDFEVQVGANRFASHGIELALPDRKGKLAIRDIVPWPSSPSSFVRTVRTWWCGSKTVDCRARWTSALIRRR